MIESSLFYRDQIFIAVVEGNGEGLGGPGVDEREKSAAARVQRHFG